MSLRKNIYLIFWFWYVHSFCANSFRSICFMVLFCFMLTRCSYLLYNVMVLLLFTNIYLLCCKYYIVIIIVIIIIIIIIIIVISMLLFVVNDQFVSSLLVMVWLHCNSCWENVYYTCFCSVKHTNTHTHIHTHTHEHTHTGKIHQCVACLRASSVERGAKPNCFFFK